ncbi:LysR family transcriptional regulator [Fluviibacterium sp. DFM31]|uniref:LysR family transcriptional regulator n=1 Tax=Meridianimarinicoccus marinus TaxID=3231483 RepID=A0ABV3L8C0_9RHOB
MMIEPRHLVQLAVIVEKASFTEAARSLNVTQPALSKMISQLEKRLDAPLLSQRRPVLPTPLGEKLAQQGRLIQTSLNEAGQAISDRQRGLRGRIRLGAPPFFLETLASDVVRDFSHQHPDVAFEFVAGFLDEVRDLVLQRRLDLALGPVNATLNAPLLRTERLILAQKALFCRSDHPLLSQPSVTAEDLASVGWIGHSPGSVITSEMKADLFDFGVEGIELVVASASVSLLLSLLETTDYLSYLPLFMMRDAVRSGRISALPVTGFAPRTPLGLIHDVTAMSDPLVRAFADTMKTHLIAADLEILRTFPYLSPK